MFDLSSFYGQFREEASENARVIAAGLLQLERTPNDRATLDAVFRAAHTLKGSARLLGFTPVGAVAHALESLLDAVRGQRVALTPTVNDVLLRANDAALALALAAVDGEAAPLDPAELIAALEASADPAIHRLTQMDTDGTEVHADVRVDPPLVVEAPVLQPAPEPLPLPKATPIATVRVRVDRLDRLLTLAGELTVGRQSWAVHQGNLARLQQRQLHMERTLNQLVREVERVGLTTSQHERLHRQVDQAQSENDVLGTLLRTETEAYAQQTTAQGTLIEELEAEVFAARLVPVATLFAPLPRAVRELSRALGKTVELHISGEQTEADRKVLDGLADPLLHLVRNALDHGIEAPEERRSQGKAALAQLTLRATTDGAQMRIAVSDDGRGMDAARLRQAAVSKGMLDAQAAARLDDTEALELIFAPGFSTSAMITDVSGRGVGMDVVRSQVANLGGTVEISSTVGVGSTITLSMPVSLMTSRVVLVEAGEQVWAFPVGSCNGLVRVTRQARRTVEGQAMLDHDGRLLPLVGLAEVLGLPTRPTETRQHALLLGTTRLVALLVDRLVDERPTVIKPLGALLAGHPLAVGGAPLVDGRIAPVLSVQGVLDNSRRTPRLPPPVPRPLPRLLVADDSFTTRELLRSILESAGYTVATATDGQDALETLRTAAFDVVVSDVEMPRLDGFALTRAMRVDAALADVPVILVTSLHSDEHKRAGALAGAQAYIVKSQFDQQGLLEAIRQVSG